MGQDPHVICCQCIWRDPRDVAFFPQSGMTSSPGPGFRRHEKKRQSGCRISYSGVSFPIPLLFPPSSCPRRISPSSIFVCLISKRQRGLSTVYDKKWQVSLSQTDPNNNAYPQMRHQGGYTHSEWPLITYICQHANVNPYFSDQAVVIYDHTY